MKWLCKALLIIMKYFFERRFITENRGLMHSACYLSWPFGQPILKLKNPRVQTVGIFCLPGGY